MRRTAKAGVAVARWLWFSSCVALGCGNEAVDKAPDDGAAGSANLDGASLELSIGFDSRTFVELAKPSVVEVDGQGEDSIAWDLAFQGRDIFSNGGISGPGNCSAFGPLSPPTYLSDTAPDVPLLLKDRAGGALLDWYDYVGGAAHQLFSRYHVYGLRDGDRLFKLQVLGYYGERLGAPVSALYHVRYAEVTEAGPLETHDVSLIDATAGGSKDSDTEPSACLELDRERVSPLTPDEARMSTAWQLCFRREAIAINGGLSGPRGMEAVDLQADQSAEETEAEVQARSAESEQARFDAVDFDTLSDSALAYRPDGIVTAFAQRWLEPGSDPLALSDTVWLVIGADGASKSLVRFSSLVGDPATERATLRLEAKSVR